MPNYRMIERVKTNEVIDISNLKKEGNYYVLPEFTEGKDYCVLKEERWIWSIGERISDGVVLASHSTDLYQNPLFKCLWLR